MTTPFQMLTLGVGDAFSDRYYHTSFVLMAEGMHLLIDCPEPIRKILREASEASGRRVNLKDIDDVVLTHLHADHASAWETICHWKRHRQPARPRLYTSPEVLDVIWDQRLRAVMGETINLETGEVTPNSPSDYFEGHALSYGQETAIGPFHVSIRRTKHVIPTVGLIVRVGDMRWGYACDTIFDPEHIKWLSQADMIVHETNDGPHTPLEDLMGLPQEIRDKIWLVHYPDSLDPNDAPLNCLRQGQLLTLTKEPPGAVVAR
ncbi:MBL fold metallo-hydrolase [Candidatus Sumerlaeota bacterium]|nr:MBL fold metallo-hydrolase [Candidatus Sumerlaeota bacterium]